MKAPFLAPRCRKGAFMYFWCSVLPDDLKGTFETTSVLKGTFETSLRALTTAARPPGPPGADLRLAG
ncbi:hypothetical protein DMC63_27770 [Streptomyces sp. WAC 05977]|nr:hypothetical protein DMC63_27770 [Streptomyces sp. WAC 05977]